MPGEFLLIGLGLAHPSDISVRALKHLRTSCGLSALPGAPDEGTLKPNAKVYLECYTSIFPHFSIDEVSKELGVPVLEADRTIVEQQPEDLFFTPVLEDDATVALLIVGDPFSATTHSDLTSRAAELGVPMTVYHNASIMNAVGATGLQLYRFGQTVSIPFFNDKWRPHSFATKIRANVDADLHTMCLLDIKVKEQTDENLLRGRAIFEPPRFMSIATAARQLLESLRVLGKGEVGYDEQTTVVAVARIGSTDQLIASMSLAAAAGFDAGTPLHTLLLCGSLHVMEEEAVSRIRLSPEEEKACLERGERAGDVGTSDAENTEEEDEM